MKTALHLPVFLLMASIASTGCAVLLPKKDATRFYQLTPLLRTSGGASVPLKHPIVLNLQIAGHLQNASLAERVAPNQIQYRFSDQWALPLVDGLDQALRDNLTQITGVQVVRAGEKYLTHDVYPIEIQIRELELLPGHRVQLAASWRIQGTGSDKRTLVGEFRQETTYPVERNTVQGAVMAFSRMLSDLTRQVASDLQGI